MSNGNQRIAVVTGDRVTVADRNADGALGRATVDVTDEDSVQQLFEQTGPVDVVVNCAGFSNVGLITDMPVEAFREVVDVCLTGAFIVAKHAGRNLRPGGALVSIGSLNGRQPAAGMSTYRAAKAGLSMLTQVTALELGPRGIRVTAVAPGWVHTPLTEPAAAGPGVLEEYLENTALGRAGTPEEIAAGVMYLCSPASSWLTGKVLGLKGGAHLKRYPDILRHVMKLAEAQ